MADKVQLDATWLTHLQREFEQDYMRQLKAFLRREKQAGKTIYPKGHEYFNALNTTPLDQVKVVILGQDPYHGVNQAHGLCFSVQKQAPIPPSLLNIYKELQSDLDLKETFAHGNLTGWAQQGVLLLNAVLSVEQHRAASHQNRGWERFTDRIVEVVSAQRQHCVFLLWGAYAQKKGRVIDTHKHQILTAPHPSPLSAHRGFLGCRHFSLCNKYLSNTGQAPIQWMAEGIQ